ncbi:RimK family protein [Candidatus Sumerlaeota bacterium]|nr:RimK family protein [Candidatus Sumerlaeota bacterium]
MAILIVVDNPKDWPPELPDVNVVDARTYLTNSDFAQTKHMRVFNLCSTYEYQSLGYYVSLLAAAREHRPLPSVMAIQEMKSTTMLRFISDELDELIQKSLSHIQSDKYTLSIYFGKNVAKRYDRLCGELFKQFEAPLLRAKFVRNERWILQSVRPVPTDEIPEDHWPAVLLFATDYFDKRRHRTHKREVTRYDLAILHNPDETHPPSNERAMKKFVRAAEELGFGVELITKDDFGRIAEFDALFIRETTLVHHHTYRFAQRAAAEGLVVIDDPESILKCSNKVFLAELLDCNDIDKPKTMILHKNNIEDLVNRIGLPCVIKEPDSSFSRGVVKVETEDDLQKVRDLFDKSDLVIAQEFVPTEYDWRIGIIDQKPIYVCKYHMAKKQWKIQVTDDGGKTSYGSVDTIPVKKAPKNVIDTALKIANLIGDGLYGVDLKQHGDRVMVIEVNDNPNIDGGFEDSILKDELYGIVMKVFLQRVEQRKEKRKSS